MKKFYALFIILCMSMPARVMAVGDEMYDDFDSNAFIVDSGDADIRAQSVSLNSGADVAPVDTFDIAGIMLGMHFDTVYDMFTERNALYKPRANNAIEYTMHNDWKYNLDYECNQQNIVIPTELEKCIRTLARNRGILYASELHLVRDSTGETIDVYFTSNETDNVVRRIVYKNDVNTIPGDNPKFENQRQKKILVFWQHVLDKYNEPNAGTDKWISSSNAYDPMMTAYYDKLVLENQGLHAQDEALNIQRARENFRAKSYAF